MEVQYEILVRCADFGIVFDVSLTNCHFNWYNASRFKRSAAFSESSFHGVYMDRSLAVLAAAPLFMGLLIWGGAPDWHPASPALWEACRCAVAVCNEEGAAAAPLALTYALHISATVPCTLLGMAGPCEVEEVAAVTREAGAGGALEEVLGDEWWRALRWILVEDGPFQEVRLFGARSLGEVKIAEDF